MAISISSRLKVGIRAGLAAFMLAAGFANASAGGQQEREAPTSQGEVQLSFAPIVKSTAPAVVNIYTKKIVRTRRSALSEHPIFRRFFGEGYGFGAPQERIQGALGSGVIVRPSGIIITNNHVIEDADEITIVLSDRREMDAEVVLADPRTDLAVLKVDTRGEDLPALPLSDSDRIEVGDLVLAIGNPFGIGQTVTSGIVSGTARTKVGISDFGFFIQTDAAVNPGNSGGALVGLNGQLLGINTAIFSRSGGSNGIGFAVPANMVRSVLTAALSEGQIVRPWLGVKGQTVTSDLAATLGLDRPGGVLIDSIYPSSPAARAGLNVGDVILALGGKEVIDQGSLNFRVATLAAGESVTAAVLQNGDLRELSLTMALPPEDPAPNETVLDGRHPFQGVRVANMSPRMNEEIGIDAFRSGVVVLGLDEQSPSRRYQFVVPGDVIYSVNGVEINRVRDLVAALETPSESYLYEIERGRTRQLCQVVPNRSYRCRQQN